MLYNELFEFCKDNYASYSENCGNGVCNHPSGCCSGECANCLDEVHWGPTKGKRIDYDCNKLILAYALTFTERYKLTISTLLKDVNLSLYPFYNIFSIGCGATPDLMAFEEICDEKNIFYKGFDRNPGWMNIHDKIYKYACSSDTMTVHLNQVDIFDFFKDESNELFDYNIIIVQYLISHLYNTGQSNRIQELYEGIAKIALQKISNSPLLIIINDVDSYLKGRNLFHRLLNILEDYGFIGKAIAYSKYANGDLGKIRWGERQHRKGIIEYYYKIPPANLAGAALVIELEVTD